MTYQEFILSKVPQAESFGFEPPSEVHPCLKEHQRDIAAWMLRGGRRANFSSFGLGKSRVQLQLAKWICEKFPGKKYLITAPLGVRAEFIDSEGPAMGMEIEYCRNDAEIAAAKTPFIITNYERVRDGGITLAPEVFAGAGLDEASTLRSYGSKTYQNFLKLYRKIPYRFVFTATPSPNKHKELIHYAGFLGVMDTGEALTRFFKRDSKQANNLTLYPHMEEKFWLWLASWAVFMQRPSDLGYSDDGYDLPPLKVHWHCLSVDHTKAWNQVDDRGQRSLIQDKSSGLKELAEVKQETILSRIGKAKEIISSEPMGKHWLLWHDLEEERRAIEKAFPVNCKTAYGSQDLDEREDVIQSFARGQLRILATKPSIAGSGTNLQRFCSDAIFLGSSYKFNDFIQSVHRIQRFQQPNLVNIHVIFTESETPVVETLKAKWAQHNELVGKMVALLKKFKLSLKPDMQLIKSIGCERVEVQSETFRAINNDSVLEVESWPDNCVDEIVTSIPFGNQYEYSPSFNDMGHNPNNDEFFKQLDFLIPHLLRVLKPGRVACIHVKDRIRFGNVTGKGMPTLDRFSDKTADRFEAAGFAFMGRITIDTDVARENAQTYRLGWTENSKDSTKMGVGVPEYVLLCRKLPTDTSDAYADLPVTKDKSRYTRAHWQLDASELWRSNGNRLFDATAVKDLNLNEVGKLWKNYASEAPYDYKKHAELCLLFEDQKRLPSSFMLFPPVSKHPDIWTDIIRMRVLNSKLSARGQENHVCPLQLDIVERLINRYSNPGEIIYDPFAGIGTVPYCAIKMKRVGWASELSKEYWANMVGFCEQAEAERDVPTLFDFAGIDFKEAV